MTMQEMRGLAYLFDIATGTLQYTFHHPSPENSDNFGLDVFLTDQYAIIGAQGDDTGGTNVGSVYIFDLETKAYISEINGAVSGAALGVDFAVHGDYLMVGAYTDDTNDTNAGRAHLYDIHDGSLIHTFDSPDPHASDFFGRYVDIHGQYGIVSDYLSDTTDIGRAHVFDLTTGMLKYTLENPTADNDDRFGIAVHLTEHYAIIGAQGDDDGAGGAGAFYIFDVETGVLLHTVTGVLGEAIGRAISFHNGRLLVSAHRNDTGASNAGAVHIYELTDSDTLNYASDTVGSVVNLSGNDTGSSGHYDNSSTISFEDFTDTLATGWTGATVDDSDAGFGAILGRIGPGSSGAPQSVYKTYTVGTQNSVVIAFDLLEIDSWDGEDVKIYIDDTEIVTLNLGGGDADEDYGGTTDLGSGKEVIYSTVAQPLSGSNIGYGGASAGWYDQIHKIYLRIENPDTTVKLGFGTDLNAGIADESLGIDNVRVYAGSEAEGDSISGFENVTGGSGADTLTGNELDNVLTGNAGADFLSGAAGDDTVTGGAGDDIIQGHSITQGTIDLILAQNPNLIWNAQTNSFYEYVTTDATWDAAKAAAEAKIVGGVAGHLTVIETAIEQTFIQDSLVVGNYIWIGASDKAIEGEWRWYGGVSDGIQFWSGNQSGSVVNNSYQRWAGGNQPDNFNGAQHYAALDPNYSYIWDDAQGSSSLQYIIEWDAGLMLEDYGQDNLLGGDDNDIIYGHGGTDTLSGDDGDDLILAGDEGDFVRGGSGSDALHGGEGDDIIHGHSLDQAEIDAILLANSNVVWNAQTNSFYELVSSAVTWDVAKAAAEASLISGTAGHLAVVTSQTESDYLLNDLIPGQAWLGGANLLINNDWLWYGGPENGLQFWQGTSGGSSINNFYQNFKSGQPNNAGGNQYYLRKESSSGEWLDDAETTRNYIIEWDAGLISDDNAADSISGGVGNDTLYGYGGDDVLIGDASNVYYEESLKYFYKLDENEGTGADEILGSGLDITLGA